MKTVAIVGGGIFGVTAAVHAARAGYEVHLFERNNELLSAASGINQYRLHRGYHYPRSIETATSSLDAEKAFCKEYGAAVTDGGQRLYAIAREQSLVDGSQFLAFCDRLSLPYRIVKKPEFVDPSKISVVIEGEEARFDPQKLRTLAAEKLSEAGVIAHLGIEVNTTLDEFDKVVIAGYAQTGVLSRLFGKPQQYQFEVCEKPVVALPSWFGETSVVVLDGPFMCVDPYGSTGNYVLGNVVHAIHSINIGVAPDVPVELLSYLNRGLIHNPEHTRFDAFIETGAPFIPVLKEARHLGSLYTIRTVLPNLEATDARPTLVSRISNRCIQIFSGKIGNCVRAAQQVVPLLADENLVEREDTNSEVTLDREVGISA